MKKALEAGCDLNCGCTYEKILNAYREGIIDEVGGIHQAFKKLYELIDEKREKPSEM